MLGRTRTTVAKAIRIECSTSSLQQAGYKEEVKDKRQEGSAMSTIGPSTLPKGALKQGTEWRD
jgi:hypothetical protein